MPILERFISVIAPHRCLVCGVEGVLVCARCLPDAFLPVPSRCYRCKRLSSDFATCASCRRQTALTHVWVRTDYDKIAKKLLYALKFERARAASGIIASAAIETMPYLPPETILIPVPTATSRVRQRGYDQSVLLARAIAKQKQLSCQRVLSRLTQSRQVGASRERRIQQLQKAFYIAKPERVKGKHVLLVDDVITTGATLEIAAKVLKQAGAKSVAALTFAHKQ